MIYHDQNKSDDRMINDLSARDLKEREEVEDDSMFDPCTIHEVMIPQWEPINDTTAGEYINPFDYSIAGLDHTHLSRIDPETGYDDFDPRDMPEGESDLERARRQKNKMKRYNVVPHGSEASHISSEFTDLLINAFLARQRMLKQGANSVQIYDNVTGKFWDIEGESEIISDDMQNYIEEQFRLVYEILRTS